MTGDECRSDPGGPLLLAFLRAPSALSIDMSSGGGKDEDDKVGDGSLGEEGPPKPEESDMSSLPSQAGVSILLPP
jgi:hypothetical protein